MKRPKLEIPQDFLAEWAKRERYNLPPEWIKSVIRGCWQFKHKIPNGKILKGK